MPTENAWLLALGMRLLKMRRRKERQTDNEVGPQTSQRLGGTVTEVIKVELCTEFIFMKHKKSLWKAGLSRM